MRTSAFVSQCPVCGYNTDRVSVSGNKRPQPKPGDYSLCMDCGELSQFDSALTLHALTPDEIKSAPSSVQTGMIVGQRIVALRKAAKKRRGSN